MIKNEKGFSLVEGLLVLTVVTLIGFVGWYVYSSQKTATKVSESAQRVSEAATADSAKVDASAKDLKQPAVAMDDWKSVSVEVASIKYPASLGEHGTCTDGHALLAIIYNSSSTDYTCNGPADALNYASIVFGSSSKSVVGALYGDTFNSKSAKIANGLTATKYVFANTIKEQEYRYVVYENVQGEKYSYAIYRTGVGFSDEDKNLKDFTAVVENGWTIK